MEKIKVYNLKKWMEESVQKSVIFYDKVAIFVGSLGIAISDYEAVHRLENLTTDSYEISLVEMPDEHTIPMSTVALAHPTIQQILDNAPYEEMEFTEFFHKRDYNWRCQSNFRGLLETFKEIGFDYSPYYDKALDASATKIYR